MFYFCLFYINRIYMNICVWYMSYNVWYILYMYIQCAFQHYVIGSPQASSTWILLVAYYVSVWIYKLIYSFSPDGHSDYIHFFFYQFKTIVQKKCPCTLCILVDWYFYRMESQKNNCKDRYLFLINIDSMFPPKT